MPTACSGQPGARLPQPALGGGGSGDLVSSYFLDL